jgi:hypothetical protein
LNTPQLGLNFDAVTFARQIGEQQRVSGMALAARSRAEVLRLARGIALTIERHAGTVTADEVQAGLIAAGFNPSDLGNAAGSLFRGKEWEFTGQWRASSRVSNHGHKNRVWRLKL